jgi:hypothetical protein
MPETKAISVDVLVIDAGTQNRLAINEETVEDYAELIEASKKWPFPPLDVFHDGKEHYVAEGFHRLLAAKRAKRASVPCIVHKGTAKDARIFGMTANDRNGLRMTRADKRACIEWLLDNHEKLTQDEIASKSGTSKRLVQIISAERRSKKAQIAPFGGSPQVSEKGEPGGSPTSIGTTPPSSGPASDEAADSGEEGSRGTTPQETGSRPPRSGKDKPRDLGKCPNCAGTKWNEGEFGELTCSKCNHPHGEPVGDRDAPGSTADVQRAKLVKTVEALMRAFDDMNLIIPRFNDHKEVIASCKVLLTKARAWR